MDFVSKGRYYENDGGRGFKAGIALSGAEKTEIGVSKEEKEEAEKGHYFQEGVQAWRSAVSGEIEIAVEIKEIGSGKLGVWKGVNKGGVLVGECREKKEYRFTQAVKRGEYIYFATETDNKAEIGESIRAGIRIRYRKIQRDELLGAHIAYQLPERMNESPDEVLQHFYQRKSEQDEDGRRRLKTVGIGIGS